VTSAEGRIGQALVFDGTSTYISTGNVGSVQTIAFWIKANNTTQKIIDLSGSAYVQVSSGTITATGFTSPTIYIDGVVASTIDTGWHHVTITTGSAISATAMDIGRVSSEYYSGLMDDVRIYSRALTASEINRAYHLGATAKISTTVSQTGQAINSGLVGHWTFDGAYMTPNVRDSSGQGNHGNLSGQTSTTTTEGRVGQALSFDGADDYVNSAYSGSLGITGDITISAWIKRSALADYGGIVAKTDGNSLWDYNLIMCGESLCNSSAANDNKLEFYSNICAPGCVQSTGSITDFQWHHVVVTRNGSAVSFYIDGVSSGGGTISGSFANNSIPVRIGTDGPDWGASSYFKGSIDDTRIYNRALSASEILRLYHMGAR